MQTIETESRQWLAGEWLNGAALAPLAELNSQCLTLVGDMASAGQGSLLQQAVGRQIAALSPEARAGLANAPYLLADAGFDNPLRWQGLARWRVEDLPRWLAGKADRAAAIESASGSNVVDHVAQDGSNNVAISADVSDLAALESMLSSPSPETVALMQSHGVVQPIVVYVEA